MLSNDLLSDDHENIIKLGQTWSLEAKSNKLSVGNSKVLFFFSNDAFNTYQARKFSDWDNFSIIDSVKINDIIASPITHAGGTWHTSLRLY